MSMFYSRRILFTAVVLLVACASVVAQGLSSFVADSYAGTMGVTVDGVVYDNSDVSMVVVKNTDGSVNLTINNFKLVRGGDVKPIGNIVLKNVTLSKQVADDFVSIASTQNIKITDGTTDDPGSGDTPGGGSGDDGNNTISGDDQKADGDWGDDAPDWYGPTYGELSVNASGRIWTDFADLSFSVSIPTLGKTATVQFTSGNVPTRITAVDGAANKPDRIYTLTGQPASPSYKGIVVVGKKKMMKVAYCQ